MDVAQNTRHQLYPLNWYHIGFQCLHRPKRTEHRMKWIRNDNSLVWIQYKQESRHWSLSDIWKRGDSHTDCFIRQNTYVMSVISKINCKKRVLFRISDICNKLSAKKHSIRRYPPLRSSKSITTTNIASVTWPKTPFSRIFHAAPIFMFENWSNTISLFQKQHEEDVRY